MLQPRKKSAWSYILQGYQYWSGTQLHEEHINLLQAISAIDDSILIVDDIIDQSEIRNNQPCLFRQIGIPWAIIQSELLKAQSINSLMKLMSDLKTTWDKQLLVLKLVYEYFWNIYQWEKIGLELASITQVDDDSVKKYFKMVTLFTWWHVDYFFRIWQLIANKEVDNGLINISISLGIIRQICDDFDDYFPWHHEPFWDFMTQSNRLPEIIFAMAWGSREEVENLILCKKFDLARSLVLNSKVKEQLHEYCKLEHQEIKQVKTTFDYSDLLENYGKIIL